MFTIKATNSAGALGPSHLLRFGTLDRAMDSNQIVFFLFRIDCFHSVNGIGPRDREYALRPLILLRQTTFPLAFSGN